MPASPSRSALSFFNHPYLLLVLTALFWSGNAVAGKAAVGIVPPMAMNVLRWTFASIALVIIAYQPLKRDWPIFRRHWLRLFATGALGMSAFNILLYNAVHYTSAINVTIEQSGIPMIIVLLNLVFFREPARPSMLIGVALSILGVLVTATHGDLTSLLDMQINLGDGLMLIAATIYAIYSVTLRQRPKMHWLSFMTALAIGAALAGIPFAVYEMSQGIVFEPTTKGVLIIAYAVLFPSLISQVFFVRGVELIGANRAGLFVNLVPLFGSVLAITLLGERAALYHGAGYALILAGIAIAQRK